MRRHVFRVCGLLVLLDSLQSSTHSAGSIRDRGLSIRHGASRRMELKATSTTRVAAPARSTDPSRRGRASALCREVTTGLTTTGSLRLPAGRRCRVWCAIRGWRFRSRFRAPEQWRSGQNGLSSNTRHPSGLQRERPHLRADRDLRASHSQPAADLRPTFERDLAGPEHEFEFEPKARAPRRQHKVTLGVEYYGSLVRSSSAPGLSDGRLRLGDELALHFGSASGRRRPVTGSSSRLALR